MALNLNLVTVGTVNSGSTAIQADVSGGLGSALPINVTLSTDYATLDPPGWPQRPGLTGVVATNLDFPKTISSGTTIALLQPEADALVTAGAATYA